MATQYTEEFKKDAVRYWKEHKDLGINACAKKILQKVFLTSYYEKIPEMPILFLKIFE